jgi:hypothetical protein
MDERLTALEGQVNEIAANVQDLDTVLQNVADAVTKLGTDLQAVFAFMKANPGIDLTAQVAKGTAIANALATVDADALAQENPIPVPTPVPTPTPIPPSGRR